MVLLLQISFWGYITFKDAKKTHLSFLLMGDWCPTCATVPSLSTNIGGINHAWSPGEAGNCQGVPLDTFGVPFEVRING